MTHPKDMTLSELISMIAATFGSPTVYATELDRRENLYLAYVNAGGVTDASLAPTLPALKPELK